MLRQGLQQLVRLAPGAARAAWAVVPPSVKQWLAPLIHPIAAGARGGGHVLPVPAPEHRARLRVVDARTSAGAPTQERSASTHTSGDVLLAGKDVSDALVVCEPGDSRRAILVQHGLRVLESATLPPPPLTDHVVSAAYPPVSIVVVTRDQPVLISYCLSAIARNTAWPNLEVILVDNGSESPTPRIDSLKWNLPVTVLRNEDNAGFARGSNQGIAASSGDFVVLLNDDTVVGPGWLSRLIAHLEADPRLGLVCPVTNEIGSEARIDVHYETLEEMEALAISRGRQFAGVLRETGVVPLFCAAARRPVLSEVGGLDERYAIGMFEDDDLSRTLRDRGYRLGIADDAFVHHVGQASFSRLGDAEYLAIWEANKRRYEAKWGERWRPPEVLPRA